MPWYDPTVWFTSFSAAALTAASYGLGRRQFSARAQSFDPTAAPADPAVENQFFVLLDAMADSALVVDGDGTIQYANASAVALLGVARSQLIGSPSEFRIACDGASTLASVGIGSALCANGAEVPVEITRTPLPIGQAAGQLMLIRDRRDHVAAERVVREERDILEAIATHCTLDEVIEKISTSVARVQTGMRVAALVRRAGVTTCFGGVARDCPYGQVSVRGG